MEPLRVGLVGCGVIGQRAHLPALLLTPECVLTAVVDRDGDEARRVAERFGVAVADTDVSALSGHVDAAIVAVPAGVQEDVCRRLLDAGIDVLCEKPMGRTNDERSRIIETARLRARRIAVGFNRRFDPLHGLFTRLIGARAIGSVRRLAMVDCVKLTYQPRSGYLYDRELAGGGVLITQGVHLLDQARLWLGALSVESYREGRNGQAVETEAEIELHAAGASCRIQLSWSKARPSLIEVVGDDGSLESRDGWPPRRYTLRSSRGVAREMGEVPMIVTTEDDRTFRDQLQAFVTWIRGGDAGLLGMPEDAVAAGEIVEACYARAELPASAPG